MKNKFSVFYDNEVKVFEYKGVSSYSSTAEMTLIKVISVDIQPYYYGKISEEEFSLKKERKMRMFFAIEDFDGVIPGNFVQADGIMYRIEYSYKRKLGAEAILKEIQ